jgi:hypothetical protein
MWEETASEVLPDAPAISNVITYQESLMREGFVKIAELSSDLIELAWNAYDSQTGEPHPNSSRSACTWTPITRKSMRMHRDKVHAHAPIFDSIKYWLNCGFFLF